MSDRGVGRSVSWRIPKQDTSKHTGKEKDTQTATDWLVVSHDAKWFVKLESPDRKKGKRITNTRSTERRRRKHAVQDISVCIGGIVILLCYCYFLTACSWIGFLLLLREAPFGSDINRVQTSILTSHRHTHQTGFQTNIQHALSLSLSNSKET